MYMIKEEERKQAIQFAQTDIIDSLVEKEDGRRFLMVLSNLAEKLSPIDLILPTFSSDSEQLKKDSLEVIKALVNFASQTDEYVQKFSTGELAQIFGVSVQSINKWINDDRFVGFTKEKGKHARIPITAKWKSNRDMLIPLKEIVEQAHHQYEEREKITRAEELRILTTEIVFFEEKYGGALADTLGEKSPEALSETERRDKAEWSYLEMRLNDA